MPQPVAISSNPRSTKVARRAMRSSQTRRRIHPTNQEVYDFRHKRVGEPLARAIDKHLLHCDSCAQKFAEIVWYELWDKLSA